MKKAIIAAITALSLTPCAQAYDKADFLRQYKDTIAIVETNYKEQMPVSEYERIQIFKKEFLIRAAEFGPLALLEKALALATHPRQLLATDRFGRTVLFYAANADTVDKLILRLQQLDAMVQFKLIWNSGPSTSREVQKNQALAQRFINAKDKESAPALFVLLRDAKYSAAKRLIERGADLDARDKDRVTALHMAVLRATNENKSAQALVKMIINQNPLLVVAKDEDGRTPADWARRSGYEKTYNYLSSIAKECNR